MHNTVFCRGGRKNEKVEEKEENNEEEVLQTYIMTSDSKSTLLQTAVCDIVGNNERIVAVKHFLIRDLNKRT